MRCNSKMMLVTFVSCHLIGLSGADDLKQTVDPHVQQCISDLNRKDKRSQALSEIARLGPKAKAAASALRAMINDNDAGLRAEIIVALGCIQDEASIPDMIRMIKNDPSRWVRTHAMLAAARYGYGAKTVIPYMIAYLSDDSYTEIVSRCLVLMGPDVCNELRKMWEDGKKEIGLRRRALRVVLGFGSEQLRSMQSAVVPSLMNLLRDNDLAEDAATALARFELQRDRDTVALLDRKVKEGEIGVRVQLAFALFKLDPRNRNVVPALACGLKSDMHVSIAAEYLAKIAALGSTEAANLVTANLTSSNDRVRSECLFALRSMGPAIGKVLPTLEKYANDETFPGHKEIAVAIELYKFQFRKQKK